MDLADITTQFLGLMNRRDLSANTTLQTNFLNAAQVRINRELRSPANETWIDITIGSNFVSQTIPVDYLELIGIYPNSLPKVRLKKDKLERVLNYATFASDRPLTYARKGTQWFFGPTPAAGDVLTIGYYSELPALVNPTDVNTISLIAWDLIVYAALVYAAEYYKDARRDTFEMRYQQILSDLNVQAEDDEIDEAMVQPTWYYPDDDADNYEIWVP